MVLLRLRLAHDGFQGPEERVLVEPQRADDFSDDVVGELLAAAGIFGGRRLVRTGFWGQILQVIRNIFLSNLLLDFYC